MTSFQFFAPVGVAVALLDCCCACALFPVLGPSQPVPPAALLDCCCASVVC